MIGYFIERSDFPGRLFCGTSADEVVACLRTEIESDLSEGLSADELSVFEIVPMEVTQEEIDKMPEFDGW